MSDLIEFLQVIYYLGVFATVGYGFVNGTEQVSRYHQAVKCRPVPDAKHAAVEEHARAEAECARLARMYLCMIPLAFLWPFMAAYASYKFVAPVFRA